MHHWHHVVRSIDWDYSLYVVIKVEGEVIVGSLDRFSSSAMYILYYYDQLFTSRITGGS